MPSKILEPSNTEKSGRLTVSRWRLRFVTFTVAFGLPSNERGKCFTALGERVEARSTKHFENTPKETCTPGFREPGLILVNQRATNVAEPERPGDDAHLRRRVEIDRFLHGSAWLSGNQSHGQRRAERLGVAPSRYDPIDAGESPPGAPAGQGGGALRYPQVTFYFYPENVEALRDAILNPGYAASDLVVRFYGMKEFEMVDPSGHVLVFGQETDEPPTPRQA